MSITIDHLTVARVPPRAVPPQANSWQAVSAAWHLLRRWVRRRAERRGRAEQAVLPQQLGDVGRKQAQARHEAGKPFWRR